MPHKVGDKSVEDVFTDTGLRKLAQASCKGDKKTIAQLVENGVDVNSKGLEGSTPLMWTLSCENLDGLTALLENGANPNQPIEGGMTPVTAAATYSDSRLLKTLLKYGGDPSTKETGGVRSALSRALATGIDRDLWDNYYILLDAGADFNTPDEYGDTFANFVIAMGHDCKVLELIERGYDYQFVELLHSAKTRIVGKEFPSYQCKQELITFLETKITPEEYEAHIVMLEKTYGYKRMKRED